MNESMTNALSGDDPKVLEAGEWLLRLCAENVKPEDVAEWQRWLHVSPENRTAFDRAQALWDLAPQVERPPWPTDQQVARDTYDARGPVSEFHEPGVRQDRLAWAAAIAALAVAAGTWWYVETVARSPVLQTRVAENRTFRLRDGSSVSLGGASTLRVAMTPERRTLELDSGEAYFEVVKDSQRPFVVRAGAAEIVALGTAFNVRRAADRVDVTVTSGVVSVAAVGHASVEPTRIRAGSRTTVAAGSLAPPTPAEVAAVLARRDGRLQYTTEPLRYVIADLQRYSEVPIEITDPHVGELLVTATVLEDDLRGWLQGLERALPVSVEFGERKISISDARSE